MKCVFALALLLHLCYSVESNINLNKEIIDRLATLNKLYADKILRMTSPFYTPSSSMQRNASSCVGAFVRMLKLLLNNVTVHKDKNYILQELMGNLEVLGQPDQNNHTCRQVNRTGSLMPFNPYIAFLKTLNNSKKR